MHRDTIASAWMKENEEIKENKKEGKAKETEKGDREGKEEVP